MTTSLAKAQVQAKVDINQSEADAFQSLDADRIAVEAALRKIAGQVDALRQQMTGRLGNQINAAANGAATAHDESAFRQTQAGRLRGGKIMQETGDRLRTAYEKAKMPEVFNQTVGVQMQAYAEAFLDGVNLALDLASMIPYAPISEPASVLNAALYFYRGKYLEGSLALVGGLPLITRVAKIALRTTASLGRVVQASRGIQVVAGRFVSAVNGTLGAIREMRCALMVKLGLPKWGCFAAGTPLWTPTGPKPIEYFREGDLVLSRPEHDPNAPVEVKVVEKVFFGLAPILHIHVGGQVIRTTPEHPFWVRGKGWIKAPDLAIGDELSSREGRWTAVEDLFHTGELETVYNLRVADYHTYFVGGWEWGFDVWAHNLCGQVHHAISRVVARALASHPVLRGLYRFRDSRLATQAATLANHFGYQRWHRRLDQAVAAWLGRNPAATASQFEDWLRHVYSSGKLARMFPLGL